MERRTANINGKGLKMTLYETLSFFDRFMQAKNYIYSMTIYHVIAILFFLYGITGFNLQTLVGIDAGLISKGASILEIIQSGKGLVSTLIICAIILGIDLVFLLILSHDFKKLNLTWAKIYIIEIIIFMLAVFEPVFRALLLFFSLNTLQIFVFYHIAIFFEKYSFSIPRYIIVAGGYILLAKILIYPIQFIYKVNL